MQTLKKLIAFNLCLIFVLLGVVQAQAGVSDSETLNLSVTTGTLDVTAASSTIAFASVGFQFSGATSTDNYLGPINISDTRGSDVGWTVVVNGGDWNSGTSTMKYDGNGTTEGRLFLDIPEKPGEVSANANGDDVSGLTMGSDAYFSASPNITFATGAAGSSSGDYSFTDFKASQYIPANTPAGNYVMTLVLTAS